MTGSTASRKPHRRWAWIQSSTASSAVCMALSLLSSGRSAGLSLAASYHIFPQAAMPFASFFADLHKSRKTFPYFWKQALTSPGNVVGYLQNWIAQIEARRSSVPLRQGQAAAGRERVRRRSAGTMPVLPALGRQGIPAGLSQTFVKRYRWLFGGPAGAAFRISHGPLDKAVHFLSSRCRRRARGGPGTPRRFFGKVNEMKRLLTLLMALAMTASLAACGGGEHCHRGRAAGETAGPRPERRWPPAWRTAC